MIRVAQTGPNQIFRVRNCYFRHMFNQKCVIKLNWSSDQTTIHKNDLVACVHAQEWAYMAEKSEEYRLTEAAAR